MAPLTFASGVIARQALQFRFFSGYDRSIHHRTPIILNDTWIMPFGL